MKKVLVLLATVLMGSAASAASGPLWACDLQAELQGSETGLVVSVKHLDGAGVLNCVTVDGLQTIQLPVNVRIRGIGAGIGFSKTDKIKMVGLGLGVVSNPEVLANNYKLGVSAGASLIRAGVSFDAALTASNRGAGFEVAMIGKDVRGLGIGLHLQKMTVTLQ